MEYQYKKPSIHIYYHQSKHSDIQEITAGIEEEGVFFDLKERASHDLVELAYQAAQSSQLGIGIGVNGQEVVLHTNKLKKNRPLFHEKKINSAAARMIGSNAARFIKGIPLRGV